MKLFVQNSGLVPLTLTPVHSSHVSQHMIALRPRGRGNSEMTDTSLREWCAAPNPPIIAPLAQVKPSDVEVQVMDTGAEVTSEEQAAAQKVDRR